MPTRTPRRFAVHREPLTRLARVMRVAGFATWVGVLAAALSSSLVFSDTGADDRGADPMRSAVVRDGGTDWSALAAAETLRVAVPSELPAAAPERRFEPLQDLNRGAWNYASDVWHIYTAPARMGWREAAIFGGVLGVGGLLWVKDDEIYEKIRAHDRDDVYGRVIRVGHTFEPAGFMGDTNPIYIGTLLLGYTLRNTLGVPGAGWAATVSAEILQSHLTAGAFRQVGKIFVGRERPFDSEDAYVFDDGTSFPSGHASVISEVAVITSHHVGHPVFTAFAYGGALAVCLQRFDSGSHWPSDTWAGMAYGTFVARQVVRRNEERRARDRAAAGAGATGALGATDPGPRYWWSPALDGARGPGIAVHARF